MPSDEVLQRTLQSHPAIKRFTRALSRDLPASLSRAGRIAQATKAVSGSRSTRRNR